MYRYFAILCALFLVTGVALAEAPDTLWTRVFGGAGTDWGNWVEETSDSGLIIAGFTDSRGAGVRDCYILRLTALGDTVWTTTNGGDDRDEAWGVFPTDDGGYLVGGYSGSYPPNGFDFHLVKLDAGGGEVWHHEYGGVDTAEYILSMCRTVDGNYVLAGVDSDSESDYYMVKVNPAGGEIWTQRLDLPGSPEPNGIAPTADSGFIVAADPSAYMVRFSAAGDTLWRRTYGGSTARAWSVVSLADGGFAVLGTRDFGATDDDFWLLRLNADGDTLWTRHYGNDDPDDGYCLKQTFDGGFILAGHHYPPGENRNIYIVRTDSVGDTLWTKSIGGAGGDYGYCVTQTADSGYVIVGHTWSFGAGGEDVYVVKLAPDPEVQVRVDDGGAVRPETYTLAQNYPNPFNAGTRIDYTLEQAARVRITVYNVLGQPERTLCDEVKEAGRASVYWDGRDDKGRSVASGLYFYRLRFGSEIATRRMLLLK